MGPSSILSISITGHATGSKPWARSAASNGSDWAWGRVTIARMSDGDEGHQRSCDLFGICAAATLDPTAVLRRDESGQPHAREIGRDRSKTAAADHRDTGALRLDAKPRFGVIGCTNQVLLGRPHLKRECALPRFRNHILRIDAGTALLRA